MVAYQKGKGAKGSSKSLEEQDLSLPPGMRDQSARTIYNPVSHIRAEFLKYGAETNGEYTHIKFTIEPDPTGSSPPPTRHYCRKASETIKAIDPLGAHLGSKKQGMRVMQPGEETTVHPYKPHAWSNPTSDRAVSYEVLVRPARVDFEQMVYILYGLARDGKLDGKAQPKSMLEGCTMVVMGNMRPCGKRWVVLEPLIRTLALVGKMRGVRTKLLRTHWDSSIV